jgi:hypothetical protein
MNRAFSARCALFTGQPWGVAPGWSENRALGANRFVQARRWTNVPGFWSAATCRRFESAALLDSVAKISIMDPQKITAYPVNRFHRAEVLVIIFMQFAARVQPNLVQHAREIHHPLGHFFRAFRIRAHVQIKSCHRQRRKYVETIFAGNHSERFNAGVIIVCAENRTQIRQLGRSGES